MMKAEKIFQFNYRCAVLRRKMSRAYESGDMETMQKASRQLDEYQKMLWLQEKSRLKISM